MEIARVTASVLSAPSAGERLQFPANSTDRSVGIAAFACGMGPLLGHWIEADVVAAAPQVDQVLRTHLEHGRRRAVKLGTELTGLLEVFAAEGVEVVVLKGAHTAVGYFPDPGTRPMADLDILVDHRAVERSRLILADLGFVEHWYDRLEYGKSEWVLPRAQRSIASMEHTHAENPWSVELHASLDRRFFPGLTAGLGELRPSDIEWAHTIAGRARVLAKPILLTYLATHASSHFVNLRLLQLVELALVMRELPETSWHAFDARLHETGALRFAYPALALAEQLVPGSMDPGIGDRLQAAIPRRIHRALRRVCPATAQKLSGDSLGEYLMWITSPRDAVGVVSDLIWPRATRGRVSFGQMIRLQHHRFGRLLRMMRPKSRREPSGRSTQ